MPVRALPADFLKRAEALKAARVRVAGPDPAPREDRPRGPARPRATHQPVKTRDYANAGRRRGGGGRGRGGRGRGGQGVPANG